MNDSNLRKVLFGRDTKLNSKAGRVTTWTFPAKDKEDIYREIKYPFDDGLVLYLLKRIEKLEAQIETLTKTKSK